ncbi:hypothetical protein AARAC_001976 [Aspergillus arachidicola]|uniref:Uncharacterized protein n=1 Tax=Aspergillus arachidicola TaxID=656916 RepID=A0A2G7FVR8_9EURO|nr:hypothetical protein AARAC_001976 [Aspergillus arachidicola]
MGLTLFASILAAGFVAAISPPNRQQHGNLKRSITLRRRPKRGPRVLLNGTVQHVHAQLLKINPNYDDDFATVLDKREATICWQAGRHQVQQLPKARRGDIEAGIKPLRGVSGHPSNGPGPGNCGRLSCSWGAAIWWCNDMRLNTFTKVLPSFNNIADGAQVILNNCQRGGVKLSGQDFHSDN